MSSLSLSAPSSLPVPSLSTSSLSLPLSPPPTSSPPPTPLPLTPNPTTTSTTTTSSSTSSLSSSIPPSSTLFTSTPPSTSSSTTASASAQQQPSSSPTPATVPTTTDVSNLNPTSSVVVYTSTSTTPSPTVTRSSSSSSSGFFSNTGAVAGTFTIIGLVSIAGVIAVALLIIRRRRSRSYEEDMEYLDKTPDLSADPSTTRVTSPDNGFTSDHGHYSAPPLPLATPPAAYYPDYAYSLHPQVFSPETPASHGYPVGYTQDYASQHIYPPDKYASCAPYPPLHPRVDPNMPNPHEYADVELDPTPVPPTQTALPDALRPSVRPTSTASKQWASTRFSVDSFYAGIATDNQSSPGQAF